MKNLIVAISICLAILSTILLHRKNLEAAAAREAAAKAELERRIAYAREIEIDQRSRNLKNQLHESLTEAGEKTVEALALRQQLAEAKEHAKAGERPADVLFRDPAMRDALEAQAHEACEKQVKALFRFGLAQQLGLNDEQTARLADLLSRRISLLTDQIYIPMMAGNVDDATMATSGRATKAAYEENLAQIRTLLGDDGFDTYQRFEKTQGDRENFQRFSSECTKNGQDLSPDQQEKLLAAMTEERLNFKPRYDFGDPSKWDFEHWYDNFSDDKLVAAGNEMEQLNDRMIQRAQALLSPEQASAFKQLLARQLNQARFVVRSTTALFGRRQ